MPITSACTPQCGIRANAEDTVRREAHYRCPQDVTCHGDGRCGEPACTCPAGGPGTTLAVRSGGEDTATPRDLAGNPLHGTPMCAGWYSAAGDYRPWHPHERRSTPAPDADPWALAGTQPPADLEAARADLIRRLAP